MISPSSARCPIPRRDTPYVPPAVPPGGCTGSCARTRAHLHGAAIGAGIELAAFAGTVLAAPDTRIRLPEVAMGLVPGAGGTVSLTRRIGRPRTCYLGVTGRELDAADALAWGIVDRLG